MSKHVKAGKPKKTHKTRKIKKKTRKNKTFWKIERVVIILAAVFLVSFLSFAALALMEYMDMNDYVEADIVRVIDTTVVLGNNCTAIVAQTSEERARSIELGLKDEIEIRPNTHDIFADALKSFNVTLESVTVDSFRDGIYYATIHLKRDNQRLRLDSKPSDAIALSLRTDSPLYIKKELLRSQGQNICK
ncbi:MAG: bifunctional nuclease family protein [archaeon]|nr:MAG: bifunctional nuclease family protein [archaeon]